MKLTNSEKKRIVNKFRKICIRNWTSCMYKIPPDDKSTATVRAIEVCLFLSEALGLNSLE